MRQKTFGGSVPKRRSFHAPQTLNIELLRFHAELGRTNVPNNLNQLTRAVNMGALMLTPEETATLLEACANIRVIGQEIEKLTKL